MPFPDPVAVASAADILLARRALGSTGPLLPPACRPGGLDDAFAIQAAVSARIGQPIAGWKCGMPDATRLVAAPIYADFVHTGDACPVWPRDGRARIEPELAFMLGHDLPPRATPYTNAEIDAAICATHLALELIGSRYDDPDRAAFADHLADSLLNQGLYLGPAVDASIDTTLAQSAATFALDLHYASEADQTFAGCHPAAAPRAPLYWLVEFLRASGQGLQAGQAVITGSYAGCIAVPLNEVVTLRFGELGSLSTRFIPK